MSLDHGDLGIGEEIHAIARWEHANAAARAAQSVTISEIGRISFQQDADAFYFLKDATPTWIKFGSGLSAVVEDTTPQLGGNFDVNGFSIVSVSNGDIVVLPNGTGDVILDGLKWPQADGAAGQFIKTDGGGQLSWGSGAAGLAALVDDLTPQLGGDLDLNGKNIDFPTTADISDCLDEDNMASDSATMLATQQSIKAYADTKSTASKTETLTNKTIDADGTGNSITNIENADIKAAAAIDAAKIADGSVSSAEFQRLDGVTSDIQGQMDAKAPIADPTFTGEVGIGAVNVSETELGILEGATLSTTELNYVDGVTSDIQTQLDAKGTMSALTDDASPQLADELDCQAHSVGFTLQTATGDGATTIDWKLGNKYRFTFGAMNETFTFTAPTKVCTLILTLIQDGTGSRTATWPATVKWAGGGTAPTLSTAAGARDKVVLDWDGTQYDADWRGDYS